jgi:hypothetical protein
MEFLSSNLGIYSNRCIYSQRGFQMNFSPSAAHSKPSNCSPFIPSS